MTNRRSFITGMALAPIAIAAPVLATAPDPVDFYWAATNSFDNDRISEDEFLGAVDRLDRWNAPTPRDFVRKLHAMFDGGIPPEDKLEWIANNAAILLARGV